MPCAANLTAESRFMALFVGQKHSGKTCAACSWLSPAPSEKRMKVLDGDGRIRGILGAPWIDKSRIDYDYYPPRMPGNEKTFFERVNQDLEALLIQVASGKCPYETYVGDSMTAFTRNLIQDAIPLTHVKNKGNRIGTMEIAGPSDYNFEVTGAAAYTAYLKSLPLNVIVTAHLEDKWDKPKDEEGNRMPYADSIVVGERLALRPKVDAVVGINFDHIFKFTRKIVSRQERFFVEFISDVAATSFPGLKPGEYDITGVNFREFVMSKVKAAQASASL